MPRWEWWRSPWVVALIVIVVFNLLYALPRYLSLDPSRSRVPLDPGFPQHFGVIVAHVVTGNVAMVTVFLQLMPWIRRSRPALHRATGMVYVFAGALPSALLALVLLPFSAAPAGKVGLATMAVLWIATTLTGFRMALLHRYAEHRRWMTYSFALALGTSWGRVISIALLHIPGFHLGLLTLLDVANWLGWVVNLLIAQWWLELTYRRQSRPVTPAA